MLCLTRQGKDKTNPVMLFTIYSYEIFHYFELNNEIFVRFLELKREMTQFPILIARYIKISAVLQHFYAECVILFGRICDFW